MPETCFIPTQLEPEFRSSEADEIRQLVEGVHQCIRSGFSREKIIKVVTEAGWSEGAAKFAYYAVGTYGPDVAMTFRDDVLRPRSAFLRLFPYAVPPIAAIICFVAGALSRSSMNVVARAQVKPTVTAPAPSASPSPAASTPSPSPPSKTYAQLTTQQRSNLEAERDFEEPSPSPESSPMPSSAPAYSPPPNDGVPHDRYGNPKPDWARHGSYYTMSIVEYHGEHTDSTYTLEIQRDEDGRAIRVFFPSEGRIYVQGLTQIVGEYEIYTNDSGYEYWIHQDDERPLP